MKRLLLGLLIVLIALFAVLLVRAWTLPSKQLTTAPAPALAIDRDAALQRLSRAIQFRTISHSATAVPGPDHDAFVAWLAQAYPRAHAALQRESVGKSLLYTWQGSDPKLQPLLLTAHYDVVPVEPGTESRWTHPPYSGAIAGGYVWGRGTIDDKSAVLAILEAVELLVAEGHRPKRTILLAFGHDEEVSGRAGAAQISRLLASRGVKLDAVLDEGGGVTTGVIDGAPGPVAVIGTAEKGFASIELLVKGKGGHSSMPPPRTTVGILAAAIDRVQRDPMPASVRGAAAQTMRWAAPEMPFGRRVMMANTWLFGPLLGAASTGSPALNAMLRTTTAPTMISGGVKDNVIPAEARAVVNFRLLPGDSSRDVLEHVRQAIDDPAVTLRFKEWVVEASPVSDPDAPQFAALQKSVESVFPDAIVVPYLTIGGTDARHYTGLTPNVYRFVPLRLDATDLTRAHGTDERVSVDGWFDAIRFYRAVMGGWG